MSRVTPRAIGGWLNGDDDAQRIVAGNGARAFTLEMLKRQVAQLCQQLLGRKESRWALCFEDSYHFTIGLLAVLHAGKVPVIPGHCRQSVLQEQADEFDGLLTDASINLSCPLFKVTAGDQGSDAALPEIADDARIVLFTSGSTGKPRQVVKPVRCLDEESRWLAQCWGERLQGCCVVASVTHQHMYGLTFRIWLPMALGLSFDSRQLLYTEQLTAQDRQRRYVFISSPAFLRRIDRSLAPPSCRLIVSAGGALPWTNAEAAQRWFATPVDEIYGSTETGVLAWRSRQAENTPWRLFAGVSLSPDEQDNWWARSALIPHPAGQKLDDRLAFDDAGNFQLCGRHDRVVKIEDKRISLSEIERRLLDLPEIADAVALPIARSERCGIGVVLVLTSPALAADLPQLKRQWRHQLHQWLEPLAMPRFWRVVEVIPHNSQSKRAWPQIQALFHATR
ncbi:MULTISPECIES: AMP-binding protein [Brenneria]|uniref:AMP-binding protein n=1 Tax=Brenneria nigrifluens DSM 30175 = ATCC 13028 TaxID=1121120 RepID=A0A2U1UFX5_9GAMM|nr:MULTISPECIES: AMP-binding protein [Brenneria]EHD23772.1 AMP-dependent synthetase and ligase [Brenneria sp. EniD312]PWC20586.1 AMP-binding protein [Brenneria nigrifluens] [Brenneria nigrifluens DSM 30175 = ATCC 13028]QCR06684.1 acyl-CoA synthetase [Brenneria nigrifluens] [Brenneria nigrifluens DSM 30175 = ATCC 13028]